VGARFVQLDVTDDASVAAAAEVIVRYALIPPDGPTGGFFDRNGAEAW
jgi:hypothetical protein